MIRRFVLHQDSIGKICRNQSDLPLEGAPIKVTLSSFEEEAECGQQHEKERGQEASVYEYESSEESSSSNLISVCSMSTSPILSASQLTRLLTLMTFGSLFLYLSVMFIKLNDVNDGARNNRSFLYVTVPSFAAIGLLPWVATFGWAFFPSLSWHLVLAQLHFLLSY